MRIAALALPTSLLLAASLSVGCGGAAPAAVAPTSPSATTEGPSAEPAAPETAASDDAEAEPTVPRARIVKVAEVEGAPGDRRVKIEFVNPTKAPCVYTTYTMVWPGGRKTIEEKPFEVPAGGKRQRSLRMHPNDGDLTTLSSKDSEIELSAGCSGE